MTNPYELVVLFHPDLEIDLEKPLKKVENIITTNGGKITKQDNWGKRKLAYTIRKEDHAVYVYYELELPAESVKKVEANLNITDEVIRYLLVKPGPEIEDEPTEEGKEAEDKNEADASDEDEK